METLRPIGCPSCGHELSAYEPPQATRGERSAARIASIVAGWGVPVAILAAVLVWGLLNLIAQPFEPYPVIALAWISAVLATVAACQGPLILLSQRRSSMNDRARDEEAFRVATHAEADLHALATAVARLDAKLGSKPD